MKRMRATLFLALLSLLLTTSTTPSQAGVVDISECRIPASKDQTVSLGFPLRPERISSSKPAQILVIPIAPSDVPDYQFRQDYIDEYKSAASNIERLSFGRAKINYIFAPVHRSQLTVNDFIALGNNVQSSWDKKDLTKSTWGFVRNTIKELDPGTNFTNVDAVILEAGSPLGTSNIAEAMMFYSNSQTRQDGWFDPIKTDEGLLSNAILFDKHNGANVITHEIMHLFGLTDLYGGISGPERLSVMIDGSLNLLNYEKWVLGWLDNSNVTCLDGKTLMQVQQNNPLDGKPCTKLGERIPNKIFELVCLPLSQTKPGSSDNNLFWAQNNPDPNASPTPTPTPTPTPSLSIDSSVKIKNAENQLIIINTGSGTGIMIEIIRGTSNVKRLAFYYLDNEKRPPIMMFATKDTMRAPLALDISGPTAIGSIIWSTNFSLLVSNITQDEIFLNLIPESLKSSDQAKSLISQSLANKDVAMLKAKAAADKAATDKIIAEAILIAEAKAAADKAAAAKKRTTITCIKGKLTKKITAVKPKCPAGYKKK